MGETIATNVGRCEICGNDAELGIDWAEPLRKCARCGTFKYDPTVGWLTVETPSHTVRLSGWVRDQNDAGIEYPNITPEISRQVAHLRLPGLRERANRALLVMERKLPGSEKWYGLREFASDLELLGRSYSVDAEDALTLIQLLSEEGYLRNNSGIGGLSVQGLLAVEALGSGPPVSAQGFVAMSFDESLREAWTNGFSPAIRAAGFSPFRIDSKDYVGGVSDELIAEIRQSAFVIADYTQQKNGVYFEAGFALGMGLTVIPTCRADAVGSLHFDIKHLNTLLWSDPAELAQALSKRIVAVIGTGPHFSGS